MYIDLFFRRDYLILLYICRIPQNGEEIIFKLHLYGIHYNFLNFSGLSMGYDFDQILIKKIRLRSLGISFNANDICRWSTVKEERGTSYPYAKNYSFTVSVGF